MLIHHLIQNIVVSPPCFVWDDELTWWFDRNGISKNDTIHNETTCNIPYFSWILRCLFKANRSAKAAVQISHLKGFSPLCTLAWFFKWAAWLNADPQVSHLQKISEEISKFARKNSIFAAKKCTSMSIKTHLYGFSPVWIRRWFHRVAWRANPLSHTSQTYGFSPLCVRSWFFKCGDWENCIPQVWHL